MTQLGFISDVIYNLKRDYGVKIALIESAIVTDLQTGVKTSTYTSVVISKAILLPTSVTAQFMQQLTAGKIGMVEKTERVILIDKRDLRGQNVTRCSFVGYSGNALNWRNIAGVDWDNLDRYNTDNDTSFIRTDIKKLEDLLHALTVTVQATNGLTII